MPTRTVHDTISGTTGKRLKVRGNKTERSYEYSNGVEIVMDTVAPGIPGKMGPVKEVTRIYTPHATFAPVYRPGQYERIFGKEEEEQDGG